MRPLACFWKHSFGCFTIKGDTIFVCTRCGRKLEYIWTGKKEEENLNMDHYS